LRASLQILTLLRKRSDAELGSHTPAQSDARLRGGGKQWVSSHEVRRYYYQGEFIFSHPIGWFFGLAAELILQGFASQREAELP